MIFTIFCTQKGRLSQLYVYQQNCQNRTHSDKVNFKIVVVLVQIKLKTSFENIKISSFDIYAKKTSLAQFQFKNFKCLLKLFDESSF